MREFLRRVRYLLNRRRQDEELAGEMEFHREMAARDGGVPFGDTLRLREDAREAWGWVWIDRLAQDLRYAVRMLGRSPGFTLAAVLMLAIGIGVNVAAFSFFDLMVLRPLAVREPASLLRFHRHSPKNYAFAVPYPEAAYFSEHARTLSSVLALNSTKLAVEGEEKPLSVHFVTDNYLSDLGAQASVGRLFAGDKGPVVVLDYGFWQRHFAGDPAVIGRTLRLNGKMATVIGVAAREFTGLSLDQPALWSPITQQPFYVTGSRLLTDFSVQSPGVFLWGRMQPGLNPRVAEEELFSLTKELRKQHPDDIWENEGLPSEAGGYAQSLTIAARRGTGTEERDPLLAVFALVGALTLLILAVACGNLGSLLLARGVAREREIAIRVAVGAGRVRLVRQLFTESLVLALTGSLAGLGAGYAMLRSLVALVDGPMWMNPSPDWRVLAFAAGVGFLAAIAFGLTPALQAVRQRHRTTAIRRVLVGLQVAGSCVLLIVAGLLVRALEHATTSSPGFAYQQVISIDPHLNGHGYTAARAQAYLESLRTRLSGLPGVESVSLSDTAPLGNRTSTGGVSIEGRGVDTLFSHVDPEFLTTMKIPLLRGRNLRRGDRNVAVITESMALRLWPGRDAIGQKFNLIDDFIVVGISANARLAKLEDADLVQAFFPISDADMTSLVVLVKTVGTPDGLLRSAASIAKSIDPTLFPDVQLTKSAFQRKLQPAQSTTLAVGILGSVAHLLACLGIVGLVAYAVSQRTKEIGIRVALGAKPAHVLATVLSQFAMPVGVGLLVGIGGAAALAQTLRHQLYGISDLDPLSYLGAVGVFLITVAVATVLPARKALRVDPMQALRQD